jgi:hypothetical protein
MNKKSKLDRLAYRLCLWLAVVFWMTRVANEILDLVSKAANYNARKVSELRLLVSAERKASICSI